MWTAIFSHSGISELDALGVANWYLLLLEALAAIICGYGIIQESSSNGAEVQRGAHKLVIIGVAAEVLFSLLLFMSDERISSIQRRQILTLETRIAQRELTTDQIKRLQAEIAAVPASVPHNVVFVYLMGDQESAYFVYEIGRYFLTSGWRVDVESRSYSVMLAWGIEIWGPDNQTTRALKSVFTAAQIPFATDGLPGTGFQSFGHAPTPEDTDIFIGPKEPSITADEAARAGLR